MSYVNLIDLKKLCLEVQHCKLKQQQQQNKQQQQQQQQYFLCETYKHNKGMCCSTSLSSFNVVSYLLS